MIDKTETQIILIHKKKSPLHLAIEIKNIDIIQLLLNHEQIDVNLQSLYEGGYNFLEKYSILKSPLSISIDIDSLHIFKMIINHPRIDASINIVEKEYNEARSEYVTEFKPLHLAVQKNRAKMVKLLIKRQDVDVNSLYGSKTCTFIETTALNIAIDQENKEIVRILLSKPNINVNIKSFHEKHISYEIDERSEMTPIYNAVAKRNKEIVQMLLTRNEIDVNIPYLFSSKEGYSVYKGVKTYQIKKTPLNLAVENNDIEIVDFLLMKNDIDANICSEYDYCNKKKTDNVETSSVAKKILTPLFVAIKNKNVIIVDHLLLRPNINLNYECLIQEQNDTTRKSAINLARENGTGNENEQINNLLELYISE